MQNLAFIPSIMSTVIAWSAAKSSDRPVIGITYPRDESGKLERQGEDALVLYRQAIEANGGVVKALSQHHPRQRIEEHLERLHGVLLPGGIDVDPRFHGEEPRALLGKIDPRLDRFEFDILKVAAARRLAVLAICRGIQVLNLFYGGSLYQDLPSEYVADTNVIHRYPKGSQEKDVHEISIAKNSFLYEIFQAERFTVNTSHHQAIRKLAPGYMATARSDDGVIEAIERKGAPFMLGVQFHPEKIRNDAPRFNRIFERFVTEARRRAGL